jgi:hypothetical protein
MFKNLMEGGNRKQATTDGYERRLITLNDGQPLDNLAFLYNYDVILEKIQKYKLTTQRNFIISIVSVLKNVKTMKSMYDKYSKLLEEYNNTLRSNNTKTDVQKTNWISQDTVIQVYNKLYENVYPIMCKKSNITETTFSKITQLILLALFVLQQPRRLLDYKDMVIIRKMPKIMDTTLNYCDIITGIFYFNNYKTSKTYKTQEVHISTELQELLKCYVSIHPTKLTTKNYIYLLCNYDGTPINNTTTLTRILNKIFMEAVGKKISSNLLRNIFLTDLFKTDINKLETTAYNMGTSPNMVKNTYVKQD